MPKAFRRLFHLPLGRRGVERAVDEELRFHFEQRIDALLAEGQTRAAAEARVHAEFGDLSEAHRELVAIDREREGKVARAEWLRGVLQDVRVAVRSYLREPGFTLVVLLTLAIGIGANTAMFGLVNATLLRPLPYPAPEQLVHLWETQRDQPGEHLRASYPDFEDLRAERGVFAALEAYDETNVTVSGGSGAEFVPGARVSSGLFTMLGAQAERGRLLSSADDVSDGTQSIVLSHGFWQRHFGGATDIIGRAVQVNGVPLEVVGVLSADFRFAPVGEPAVWLPLGRSSESRSHRFDYWVNAVGRLREGVAFDAAQQRIVAVMAGLEQRHSETNAGRSALITPLHAEVLGSAQRPLFVLFGAVGLILLIACANVASLVLTRSAARYREMALRSAIGAGRGRLVRQLLTENIVLALCGALLGAWLARLSVKALVAIIPARLFDQVPALRDGNVDLAALGFTMIVAVGCALLFGLVPALALSGRNPAELIRSDARAGSGPAHQRIQNGLVMAQIALTLILLVGASLMARSVGQLLRVDPGFSAERVASVRAALSGPAYRDNGQQQRFFEELLARVNALAGIEHAGAVSSPPLQGGGTNRIRVDGVPEPASGMLPEVTMRAIAGDYFRALRIPLLQGRALDARDDLRNQYAVVVSESAARTLFGNPQAVGRRLKVYRWQDSAWTVVGIVGDVKTDALDQAAVPTVYYSHLQGAANRMTIVARAASTDAAPVITAIRQAVNGLDPDVAAYATETMVQRIENSQSVAQRRYLMVLLSAFAGTALLLAIVGVYGVIAYTVAQRLRDVAIRMALGATRHSVLTAIARNGLRLALGGILVGALASLALTRSLGALLFGVSPTDWVTHAGVSILLVLVVLAACYIPARRATLVDPGRALRSE